MFWEFCVSRKRLIRGISFTDSIECYFYNEILPRVYVYLIFINNVLYTQSEKK